MVVRCLGFYLVPKQPNDMKQCDEMSDVQQQGDGGSPDSLHPAARIHPGGFKIAFFLNLSTMSLSIIRSDGPRLKKKKQKKKEKKDKQEKQEHPPRLVTLVLICL